MLDRLRTLWPNWLHFALGASRVRRLQPIGTHVCLDSDLHGPCARHDTKHSHFNKLYHTRTQSLVCIYPPVTRTMRCFGVLPFGLSHVAHSLNRYIGYSFCCVPGASTLFFYLHYLSFAGSLQTVSSRCRLTVINFHGPSANASGTSFHEPGY